MGDAEEASEPITREHDRSSGSWGCCFGRVFSATSGIRRFAPETGPKQLFSVTSSAGLRHHSALHAFSSIPTTDHPDRKAPLRLRNHFSLFTFLSSSGVRHICSP